MASKRILTLVVCLLGTVVCARVASSAEILPLAPADTSSPRATVRSFLDACEEIYNTLRDEKEGKAKPNPALQDRAVSRLFSCLNLSDQAVVVREKVASEAAIALKEVFDRIGLPPMDEIPGAEELEEAIRAGNPIRRWRIPDTEIVISSVGEGSPDGAFLFTTQTVARATEFFKRVQRLPYRDGSTEGFYYWFLSEPGHRVAPLVHKLPDSLRTHFWGRHAIWQWLGLIVSITIASIIMALAYWWARRRADSFRESHNLFRYCTALAFPVFAMLVPHFLEEFVRDDLRISGSTLKVVTFTTSIIFLGASMFLTVAVGSRIAAIIIASPRIHPKGLDAQLIRIICRLLSLAAAVILFLEGGKYLGIPITTLLASAGIGGVALALAAQDMLKNFFGSMMIILDKPYRIGERIAVAKYDGIVEEIGLRSTKIRLLTGNLVTIPNEEMAKSDIENIGRRPHIRRVTHLRLPLSTEPDKADEAVEIVRGILEDHEGMDPGYPPRVFLNEFNEDSMNLRLCYWYHPPDYWKFLAHSQEVNLRIRSAFEEAGIELALPSTAMHLAENKSLVDVTTAADQEPDPPSA